MDRHWASRRAPYLFLILLASHPAVAAAQAASPSSPPAGAATGPSGSAGAIALVVLAVILVIAGIAKAIDLRRKREDRMLQLQSQISEALLREPSLGVSVTPIVDMSLWGGSRARIEMVGQVPTTQSRDTALRIATQEAARVGLEPRLDDRLTIGRAERTA